ncbi:MAG: 3'-5' exonuclease [Bacteroidales bacterium]|nr:3'-5' exonuclease [Bacteroidales bacterium]
MELNLKNPLVFFDLETTGIDITHDRIVELAYLKIYPGGKEASKRHLVNPTIPIPEKVTAIHGIKDEDVKDKPTFSEIAKQLANEFEGCDFAGYNSNKFDLPLLAEEFLRADVDFDLKKRNFIDVQVIFMKMEPRTLAAALKFYCQQELVAAHTAEADTRATYDVLKAQLDAYPQLENSLDALSKYSAHTRNVDFAGRIVLNDKDVETFNFGKYKGKTVEEVLQNDPGYYGWMMNSDFPCIRRKCLPTSS